MKTIVIVTEDRVGLLSDLSYILGKSNINIDGLSIEVIGKNAVIALTVKDVSKTRDILERNSFFTTSSESLVVRLPNQPGVVDMLNTKLAEGRINLEEIHSLSGDGDGGVFSLNVDKPRKAMRVLGEMLLVKRTEY